MQSLSRACRSPATRPAAVRPARSTVVVHAVRQEPAAAHPALATLAAAVILAASSGPAFAAASSAPSSPPPPRQQPEQVASASTGVTGITLTRVDATVYQKLRERDENMRWKCLGVNMYDCDGERAEAAEKVMEDMRSAFRGDK